MTIHLKSEFIDYLNKLPVKPGTKKNYRCFVKRIEKYVSQDLNSQTVRSEDDITRHASELVEGFARDHPGGQWSMSDVLNDAKVVIRHYLKFLRFVGPSSVQEKQEELDKSGEFQPPTPQEARERVLRSIALRRGQPKFRRELLSAYGYRCSVTGTAVEDVLEAAHIIPYNGETTNHVCNGLLLRSDIHALFDMGLLSINPNTFRIYCSEQIRSEPTYKDLHGEELRKPEKEDQRPNRDALRTHFENRVA